MQINNCRITTEFGEGEPLLFFPSPEEGQTMTIHAEVVLESFSGFVEDRPRLQIRANAQSGRTILDEFVSIDVPPGSSRNVEVTLDAGGLARPPEFQLGPPWTIQVEGQARLRPDDPISERVVVDCGTVTAQPWPEPPEGTLAFNSCSVGVSRAEIGSTPLPLEARVFNSSFPGVRAAGTIKWRVAETGATLASRRVEAGGGETAQTVSASPTLLATHVPSTDGETQINVEATIENLEWVDDPTTAADAALSGTQSRRLDPLQRR